MEAEPTRAEQPDPARILIADDHDLVREGFHRMLDSEPDLEVVGEAAHGREAIELCRSLRPDLVLMDVRMPEMDGLAATRMIKQEFPTTSVLVVTTYDNPDYLLEAIEAGATGYVLKDTRKRKLISRPRGAKRRGYAELRARRAVDQTPHERDDGETKGAAARAGEAQHRRAARTP